MSGSSVEAKQEWIRRVLGVDVDALQNRLAYLDLEMSKSPIIAWKAPTPVDYVAGGFELGVTVLNATVRPTQCELDYDPPAGTLLGAGSHKLIVYPRNPKLYHADPVTVTLDVNKVKLTIELKELPDVEYCEGGYSLTTQWLEDFFKIAEPSTAGNQRLRFTCNGRDVHGEMHLAAGDYKVCASLVESEESDDYAIVGECCSNLTVGKAKIFVRLAQPDNVIYAPGGYVLSATDFEISEHPSEVEFDYDPPLGERLRAGSVDLKLSLKDVPINGNYELVDFPPVTLVVAKLKLDLKFEKPQDQTYLAGGYVVSKDLFVLPNRPSEIRLTYDPPIGTKLGAGAELLKVDFAVDPVHDNYVLAPVAPIPFTVTRARATITWAIPGPVSYEPGGFILSDRQLCASVDVDELRSKIVYKMGKTIVKVGDKLSPGIYQVTATIPDDEGDVGWSYQCSPVTCSLVIEKLKFTITWPRLKPVETSDGTFTLTREQLCAKPSIHSDHIELAYNYDEGMELPPNQQPGITLEVGPADPRKYEADSVTTSLFIQLSKSDKITRDKKKRDEDNPNTDWSKVAFNPKDPRTWITRTKVVYDSASVKKYCDALTNSDDKDTIAKIASCAHYGREGIECTGVRLHCHTKSGAGGLSFAYNHVGGPSGKEVEGVIYDFTDNRDGNTYIWEEGGRCGGAALWYKAIREL